MNDERQNERLDEIIAPIIGDKDCSKPSVFTPEGLIREARRQKGIPNGSVPEVCLLDPDGDFVRHLKQEGVERNPLWACYHTDLYDFKIGNEKVGVIGCAVGASFAVLVAEQIFASGCRLLVSVTSAGQIQSSSEPPYFVLIDRALRDEGTSYHYLPPSRYVHIGAEALNLAQPLIGDSPRVIQGGVWTTDAPFRETEEAIGFARNEGLEAVEMEAAALYAFSKARGFPVVCFAHVTNRMAQVENDFEKGEADGNAALSLLIERLVRGWKDRP